jgi:Tfp pilus assembly protein PilN
MMVPRVRIHLSAPGINHLTLSQFALKAIGVVCLTLTICFWWIGTNLHKEIDVFENQTHMIMTKNREVVIQAQTAGIDLSDLAIQKIPEHISFVRQVRERVGFSWTQLLTDLESSVPESLMMSAVSLDEKTNTVLLNGSTQSLEDLNQLIHLLEKHQSFHDVILTQHAKKTKKDSAHHSYIVFSMKVSYDPSHYHGKAIKS